MKRAKNDSEGPGSPQGLLFDDEPREAPLQQDSIIILPPQDVMDTLRSLRQPVTTTILDPWYNKGVGGVIPNYYEWLFALVQATAEVSDHIFLWGFPEIVYKVLDHLPPGFALIAWLTWYYKNCPSVIRGWRSSQLACLHIAKPSARLYPEHFLNGAQLEKQRQGKLRYMPGPLSVIEAPLLVGFVGRSEQVGHPAQKPVKAIEPLVLMTTQEGDMVLDPMCGSGTTGVVCQSLGRRAILCDASEEYVRMTEKRLGIRRMDPQGCSDWEDNAF
jgi:site-specific DNA-methyltransferase (adenine-specific)